MLMVGNGSRPHRCVYPGASPFKEMESTANWDAAPGGMRLRLARRTLLGCLPALVGVGHAFSTPAAAASLHVACLPSDFPGSAHALFGFGAAGVAAAKAAAAACRDLRSHEDPGWLAALGGMPSGPYAADAVLTSEWSFSVLCYDAADQNALSGAETVARVLARRGHMPVLLGAGPLTASMGTADGQNQAARLLLPVPDHNGGLNSALAATAETLLSSVICRGIVGVDASDIW